MHDVTELVMNFDLRHPPEFQITGAEIYAAAFDMSAWADEHGFQRIGVPEHHQNEDGYISCPLMFAAGVGARTRRLRVRTGIVIAPLYDPLRLAEEVAVADLCLGGRLELGMGLGVLRIDYEAFGVDYTRRGKMLDELIPFLRQAWTGEPVEYRGRTIRVLPRPVQQPKPMVRRRIALNRRRARCRWPTDATTRSRCRSGARSASCARNMA